MVDYTDVTQLKLQKKWKKEGDITLHYIDILAINAEFESEIQNHIGTLQDAWPKW